MDVITLEEYANYLQQIKPHLTPDEALHAAQLEFIQRGSLGAPPMTKFDIYYSKDLMDDDAIII
jgi:hypothetical protein